MDYPCVFAQGTPGRTLKCFEKCVWGCVAQRPRPRRADFFLDKQFGTLRDLKGVFPVVWSLGGAILKGQMIMLWAILVAFRGKF